MCAVASPPGGSWGGQRPSRASDGTATGAMEGAAAAGGGPEGAKVAYAPGRSTCRLTAAVCRHRMPLSRAGRGRRARRLLMCAVASGSWGGRRLRLRGEVTVTGARGGAPVAGGRSC